MPDPLAGARILIAHDWILSWAGSERCVAEMHVLFPSADITLGFLNPALADLNPVTRKARETWLARVPFARAHHRWFLPLEGMAFRTLDTSAYDVVISSSHAFAKMVRPRRGAVHVSYCYSPPRYLYDLYAEYRGDATSVQRLALAAGRYPLRVWDQRSSRGVDQFIAISQFVADRIRTAYGRDSRVVFPPVAMKAIPPGDRPREDFLLSLGRLVTYKRVDLAIRAAERLGVPLVVAGDGPDRKRLEAMAGPNTTMLGAVSEAAAGDLLSRCRAFIFCGVEDFGIAPIEANAHGAPVIGLAEGGLVETMIPGETAELFDVPSLDAIGDAVQRAYARQWSSERLRESAARFAPERFHAEFRRAVGDAVAR